MDETVLQVRGATRADMPAIAHLFGELAQHHRELQPDNPRYRVPTRRWHEVTEEAFADDGQTILVAHAGDEVTGFVRMHFEKKPWGLSCEIDTLVVDEDWRGRGVGSELLDAAERAARAHGAAGMRAEILVGNDEGVAFWEAHGYAPNAVRYGKPLPS